MTTAEAEPPPPLLVGDAESQRRPSRPALTGAAAGPVPGEGSSLLRHRKRRSSLDKPTPPSPKKTIWGNELASSLIAMLQGVEVLCSLAIMYLYKDDFELSPGM
eukprot:GHVU01110431.1.p2 GENE.GHVU01110431.1~~GHVU01110431.1.p2  ORF type:complete len:104 (+),score=17.81 GHVU01110431.1:80-391(+)